MKISKCKNCEYSYRFSCGHRWFMGCKYTPYQGRWVIQIEKCPKEQDHPTEKVCTGKRCPMQVGYDVKNCKDKDCIYRTETEKGGGEE